MGVGNSSIAMSENISQISQNTNVSSQQSCNNSQVIKTGVMQVTVGNVNCENFNVGNVSATSVATCNQYQQLAVQSKVLADQLAKSVSESGIGILDKASAYASNYVDVQNNLNVIMASSCINEQDITIGSRVFTAGNISGTDCNIFNDNFTQQAACLQTIKADITNSSEIHQTADSKAIAGIDVGKLIGLLIAACVFIVLLMIASLVFKSILKPSLPQKAPASGSCSQGLGTLSSTLKSLQRTYKARTEAIAKKSLNLPK